jgi:hypothetical protein
MRIWINGKSVTLVPGMTVRQALVQSNLLQEITKGAQVIDAWGNEMGLDGALEEGCRIKVAPVGNKKNSRSKGIEGN